MYFAKIHLITFKNTKNHSNSSKGNEPIKLLSKMVQLVILTALVISMINTKFLTASAYY